ncbi:DUF397 domain-containing protein [Streptomyces harbinensis]|uniref:DUF397 domain-containing protein n=1 Tax=Streptomyces harbinensis TaxID=1176198 RepID=UPI0036B9BA3F
MVNELTWRKSSRSGAENGACLEMAPGVPGALPVRDSKAVDGPVLLISKVAWADFTAAIKNRRIGR